MNVIFFFKKGLYREIISIYRNFVESGNPRNEKKIYCSSGISQRGPFKVPKDCTGVKNDPGYQVRDTMWLNLDKHMRASSEVALA